jgi:hypothetical protein
MALCTCREYGQQASTTATALGYILLGVPVLLVILSATLIG